MNTDTTQHSVGTFVYQSVGFPRSGDGNYEDAGSHFPLVLSDVSNSVISKVTSMMTAQYSIVTISCSLLLTLLSLAPASAEVSHPNIILVMPDDVGYGDYACLGNPIMRTPAVDAFAKRNSVVHAIPRQPYLLTMSGSSYEQPARVTNGVTHTILERERMGAVDIRCSSRC